MAHRNTGRRFLILARLDANKPDQREHALVLIGRFMAWKMATSFVLTAEPWLGADGEDALLVIGVSHHERLAVVQRIKRNENVSFSKPMWLAPHHVEDRFAAVLPKGVTAITAEETAVLSRILARTANFLQQGSANAPPYKSQDRRSILPANVIEVGRKWRV